MKKLLLHFVVAAVLLSSCDPDDKDIFNFESVKLEAEINNHNEIINLGDTLKISIQLPDTIINTTGTFPVHSVQKAQFYMYINKIVQ